MSEVSVFCFLASYVVALGLECVRFIKRTSINRWVMLGFTAAGLFAHSWYLMLRSQETQLPPLLSSSHDWLLVLAWVMVSLYFYLTIADHNLPVGMFVLPIVLLLIGAAYFVSEQPNPLVNQEETAKAASHGWAMLHATLLVFGVAGVAIGVVLSLMYLVQHRRLKHKQLLQQGLKLPNLEKLARWNWWTVILTVPLLTLGMLTGVVLIGLQEENITLVDPVVLINGVISILLVGFFLMMARKDHPAGKQVAWLTIWTFGMLLFVIVGLQILSGNDRWSLDTWHTLTEPIATQRVGRIA